MVGSKAAPICLAWVFSEEQPKSEHVGERDASLSLLQCSQRTWISGGSYCSLWDRLFGGVTQPAHDAVCTAPEGIAAETQTSPLAET